MNDFSIILSLLSLAVSSYALYRGGPRGEKGDVGDTGPRGLPGKVETQVVSKPVEPVRLAQPPADPRPKLLSRQDRREQIAERAYDEDYQTRLIEIRERLREGSGLLPADPTAQTNQIDWRRRNAR